MGAQKNVTLDPLKERQRLLSQQQAATQINQPNQVPQLQPNQPATLVNQPAGNLTLTGQVPPPAGAPLPPAPNAEAQQRLLSQQQAAPTAGAPPPPGAPPRTQAQITKDVQQQILGQAESPLLQQIVSGAQSRLADPTLGADLAAQTERQLSQFDVDLAQRFEQVRRGTADLSTGGIREQVLAEEALTAAGERGRFGAGLERAETAQRSELAGAAQAGAIEALGAERGSIDVLLQGVRLGDPAANRLLDEKLANLSIKSTEFLAGFDRGTQLLLADRSEATQESLANINNKFQENQLLTKLDFDGAENALDRDLEKAIQEGDIQGQQEILALQDQFQTRRNEADQAFQTRMAGFDRDTQELLINLKATIDEKSFLTQSDFTAAQNQLKIDANAALAQGDTDKAITIQQMQNDLAQTLQGSEQSFRSAERVATQGWQSQERLSSEQFVEGQTYLDHELTLARDAQNVESEAGLLRTRSDLRLKEITQEMDETIRRDFLQDELATARADGDLGRQKDLIRFQTTQDIETIKQSQGFDAGQAELTRLHQLALQEGDLVGQRELTRIQHEFQANENLQDRKLEHLRLEFQKVGQNFDQIFDAVQAGTIDPSAIGAFLTQQLPPELRDQIKPFDADAAMRESIDADYKAQLYQFAKSAPAEFLVQGTDGELTPEGEAAFNNFINSTLFGSATQPIGNQIISGDVSDTTLRGLTINDAVYAEVFNSAPENNLASTVDPNGFWHPDVGRFDSPPAKGEFFKTDGILYRVTSAVAVETRGQDYEYFTAIDPSTGASKTFRASR